MSEERVLFFDNTTIDMLLANLNYLYPPQFWERFGLQCGRCFVMASHRPANVDQEHVFCDLFSSILLLARSMPVVFPVHQRTAKTLISFTDVEKNLVAVEPPPYLEFNYQVQNALGVMTDSGGITEETAISGVPCLALRDTTDRPEAATIGANELVGANPAAVEPALDELFAGRWKKGSVPEKWDGKAGEGIAATRDRLFAA